MINGLPDEAFLKAFEDCTLPFEQWKHRAHLKVAYLYLRHLPYAPALDKIRANIRRYNAAGPYARSVKSTNRSHATVIVS